jgi:hypothetical protein
MEHFSQRIVLHLFIVLLWLSAAFCYIKYCSLFWFKGDFHLWLFPILFLVVTLCVPFSLNRDGFSLVNPTQKKNKGGGIELEAKHGSLPINNPQRGIYILGNQGSGKTRHVLEPIIYEFIKNGYCGLVYDYDFEGRPESPEKSYCLSKFTYNCYLKFSNKKQVKFHSINFTSTQHSARVNPIAAKYISNRSYLEEYVTVLLNNLNPHKRDDFWNLSSRSLLKGIIVFLANQRPRCCTLPHVLTLATKPIADVLELIRKDEEAFSYASSIFDAFSGGEKSAGQLMGIIATLKTSLQILLNKDIFWILSADEIDLSINNKEQSSILCLGNYTPAKSAFSPIISLLLTVCFKSMYGHGRTKSFVAIDELPTLFIPGLSELPATARKYGISTVACVQSNAQLEDTYGNVGAKRIQDTLVNKIIGSSEGESAEWASRMMGKKEKEIITSSSSISTHERGSSETYGSGFYVQEKLIIPPQSFMEFKIGEFAGKIAESNSTFFHIHLKNVSNFNEDFENKKLKDLPVICSEVDIEKNFLRIKSEVDSLFPKA